MKNSPLNNFESLPDEELLYLSFDNPSVYEKLVDRYETLFLRKAYSILKNREDAEDIVQETFVKMYVHGRKYKPVEGASFKSWAYKVLVNTCLTHYKKKKREREMFSALDPELLEVIADKNNDTEQKYDTDYLISIIARLPDLLGRSLKLYYIDGKRHKEIAKMEGVAEGVIRARVHRAKKEIKKMGLQII